MKFARRSQWLLRFCADLYAQFFSDKQTDSTPRRLNSVLARLLAVALMHSRLMARACYSVAPTRSSRSRADAALVEAAKRVPVAYL
jgi:hypothetical protein